VNNTDWPGNNIKFWRESGENGIWRWIIFDTDFGFGIWDYQDVSNNTLDFALDANGPSWPNPPWSTRLLRNLMDNVEFKHLFINAFADQLNTTFLANNVHGILEKAKSEIQTEIEDHLNRWGGSMDYWNSKVNEMYQFALGRPQLMRGFIIDEFNLTTDYELILETSPLGFGKINLNTITPESYPWSGRYFTGIPVTATAEPNPGYEFVRWEGDVSSTNPMVNYSSFEKSILRAVFAPITTVEESIVINEINYSSSPDHDTDDWVELYNRGSISIDLTDWVLKDDDDNHAFVFPNISIQPNEYLVVTKDSELFSSFHPGVNHVGDMDFGLSSNGDCVRLFNDTDDLLDVVCYEEESPWPEEANGQGSTLALGNPSLDNANPLSWYALNDNGNPGEDNINSAIVGIDGQMAVKNNLIIYPNPASNIINIKIELENSDNVTLLVHDSQGKEVKRIFRGNLPAGYSDFSLNIDQKTAPGLYYIRMLGNNHQKSVKILIDKQ
jgi:hypothetical protein